MTTSPRATERNTPRAGSSPQPASTTPADTPHTHLPACRSTSSDALVALSWYEQIGHAAIFPCGDDDVERLDA
ncbi:MAG: hypothetical protein KatS3mg108_0304 [Isosphaeraceae bacterium]|jgi:hypothetical protein|nr:MAG: hypothetical protein KatS3mg108_0304 [Isosphaeraceae bacterium]